MLDDTIVAIATAIVPQQGSVGIVRLSGDRAEAIAKNILWSPANKFGTAIVFSMAMCSNPLAMRQSMKAYC